MWGGGGGGETFGSLLCPFFILSSVFSSHPLLPKTPPSTSTHFNHLFSHPTLPTPLFQLPILFSHQRTHTKKTPNTPHHTKNLFFFPTHTHRNINQVSSALRAEFARGDGRVKRKEDERRKKISPSETLFVVNFHEETTKREDLQMLFEPYGELVRIEMKRNYAFVQFRTVEEASRAKDATNGGKLDQSEITVEFVARRMGEGGGRDRGRKLIV
jgi:hypothetical protein